MKKALKRILPVLLCLFVLLAATACGADAGENGDVVILFTNDVHCGMDEDIGYAGLAAYRDRMKEQYRYVTLVDCGDSIQGDYAGTVSKGGYLIDLMNAVGYDYAIFGNHEFDYGIEQLKKNVAAANAQYLNSNITYTGSGEDWIGEQTKPYAIQTYGDRKVAFLGVTTPWSISTSTPTLFQEDGAYVYDFCKDETGDRFFHTVQGYVDECRAQGADFVVVLSHLGIDRETEAPYTSLDLIEHTNGIDVLLDGHSHIEASCWIRQNKDGGEVLYSSTGTKLHNIGKLVLSPDGTASVGYIEEYPLKNDAIEKKIETIRKVYEEQLNAVVGHTDVALSIYDGEGVRLVRNREIPIGNFVADAYRTIGEADIGMCNGGGIRAGLNAGDITYQDVIAVNPFGNTLCVVKVTGAEILDMLEYFYRYTKAEYKKDGSVIVDDGSFQQVSGIRFTIDTSVESSVVTDEADTFLRVDGARRVSSVEVLKDGVYTPIDPAAVYTLASHDYMIKNGGSGMLLLLAGHELVIDEGISDYQLLIDYLALLGNDLSDYEDTDGRITVK